MSWGPSSAGHILLSLCGLLNWRGALEAQSLVPWTGVHSLTVGGMEMPPRHQDGTRTLAGQSFPLTATLPGLMGVWALPEPRGHQA